jgi:chemotaxis response regulator CheB
MLTIFALSAIFPIVNPRLILAARDLGPSHRADGAAALSGAVYLRGRLARSRHRTTPLGKNRADNVDKRSETSGKACAFTTVPKDHAVIVIGGSMGGVLALKTLVSGFRQTWNASIFVVLHIDGHRSYLPELLSVSSTLPVSFARHGEVFETGHIYVAPPDLHMTVDVERISLSRGPKHNFVRPAIDPLFFSAARHQNRKVIGVLLTGRLSDGVEGLYTLQQAGACTIVQNPEEAIAAEMPRNALSIMTPKFVCTVEEIPRAIEHCLQTV